MHTSFDKSLTVLFVSFSLIFGLTICPQTARGDSGGVELTHIPQGLLLEVKGQKYMAYDLETFKEIAKVDARLTAQLKINEELQLSIAARDEKIGLLQHQLKIEREKGQQLQVDLDAATLRIKEMQELQPLPPADKEGFWDHWEHLTVNVVLLAIIGGLIYASTSGS